MGLSAPKQKQRLVGSASTRNTAWLNDASAPGQRMMAQMGWSTGQSLGSSMTGLTENLKVAYKMDNKGIGAQRHEKEARASGKDVWVGGGGDLGSLFERLNAANAAPVEDQAEAEKSERKKDKKGKSRDRSEDEGKPSKKKRKTEDTSTDETEKKSKREAKASKKDKKSRKKDVSEAISTLVEAEPALAKDKTALAEIKQDAVQGRPVRLAHRAKFLRAKRMVSASDLASVNEILGIASTPSSPAPGTPNIASGTVTPAPTSKKYPGPGGAEIQLMDVDKRLTEEADVQPEPSEKKVKKEKKSKKDKEGKEKRSKKSKKADKEEQSTPISTPPSDDDEGAKDKQIGTNTQGLHVFEYLNRRLMLRKAQIARQKKAEHEAIFTRAAAIGAS